MISQFSFIQYFFLLYNKRKANITWAISITFSYGIGPFLNSGKTTNYITETDLKAREVK